MSYRHHAIAGFSWQTVQKGFNALLSFAKIFVLARILSPEDFGLFSLTMIALGITESFTETGINITMIQSKNSIRYYLNTAWVIAIMRGFAIGILMILLGWFMSNYYSESVLLPLISVTAFVPIIKGFINPAITQWQKSFDFFHDSLYNCIRLIIEVLCQVILALIIHSVWALAIGLILSAIFEVLLSFIMIKERPVFVYLKSRGEEIFKNARGLNIASLLNYLNDNVDDFLLGKLVGTAQLGIYHNSYALSHEVNYELSKSAYHGVLPIFSEINQQHDQQRLKRAFRKSLWSLLGLATAASLPLLLFPGLAVRIVLGDQWLSAIPLLRILTIAGIIHSVSNFCYSLMVSRQRYHWMNAHMAVLFGLTVIFILVLGKEYGLLGAVTGIVLARLLSLPLALMGTQKALQ